MKLSIITVVFNALKDLQKTIESVIDQTGFESYEHIVIDGNSTDGSKDFLKSISENYERIIWKSEPDKGIYDAMNKGINCASGEYLLFLNAGDILHSKYTLAELFASNKIDNAIMYGDSIIADNTGKKRYLSARPFNKKNLFRYGTRVVCHQSFFVKRDLAPEYDLNFRLKGELDWYFLISNKITENNFYHSKTPIVYYALGGEGDLHFWENFYERFLVIRKHFGILGLIQYLPWAGYFLLGRLKGKIL